MAVLEAERRQQPELFKQLMGDPIELSVVETAALCNESSGLLGHAMRRFLKEAKIKVASKDAVYKYFRESWHESTTGTITIPDPKRPSKLLTAGYLRVKVSCTLQPHTATRHNPIRPVT